MVFLENLRRADQFEMIVRALAPRQFGNPLQIRADHLRLHGFATSPFESSDLALNFGPRFLGQLELRQLLAQFGDLLRLIVVSQLLLDRLELFTQEHLALTLTQFFLDLRLDVFLCFQQTDLALHVNEHAAQALLHRERFQQSLLLGHREFDIAGNQIGELAGIVDGVEHLMHDFLRQSAFFTQFGGAFARLFVERLERRVLGVQWHHLLGRNDHGDQMTVLFHVLQGGCSLLALKQQLHATKSALNLTDPCDNAGREQNVCGGFFSVVALGHGKNQPVALHGVFNGTQGAGSARRNGCGNTGEHDRAAEWQHRECLALAHVERSCRKRSGAHQLARFAPCGLRHRGRHCNFSLTG